MEVAVGVVVSCLVLLPRRYTHPPTDCVMVLVLLWRMLNGAMVKPTSIGFLAKPQKKKLSS